MPSIPLFSSPSSKPKASNQSTSSILELIRGEEQRNVDKGRTAPIAGVTQAPLGNVLGPQGLLGGAFSVLPFQSKGLTDSEPTFNKDKSDQGNPTDPLEWLKQNNPYRWMSKPQPTENTQFDPSNPFKGVQPIKGLKDGGHARRGQPYVVGENGPEYFIPSQNGTVIPNHMAFTADDFYKQRDPTAITSLGDLESSQRARSLSNANYRRDLYLAQVDPFQYGQGGGGMGFFPAVGGGGAFPFFGGSGTGAPKFTDAQIELAKSIHQGLLDPYLGTHSWDDSTPYAEVSNIPHPTLNADAYSNRLESHRLMDLMRDRRMANAHRNQYINSTPLYPSENVAQGGIHDFLRSHPSPTRTY